MPEFTVNNFQNDILDKKNQYEISHRKTKSVGLVMNNTRGRAQSNTSKKDSVDFSRYQIVVIITVQDSIKKSLFQ